MNDITAILPYIKLQFNMEHPSYEESYAFGYECGRAEITEEENPFRKGSTEAEYWIEGWWDAIEGETPLFELNHLEKDDLVSKEVAANDQEYVHKNSILSLVIEISGAIAASALLGYQLFELVA